MCIILSQYLQMNKFRLRNSMYMAQDHQLKNDKIAFPARFAGYMVCTYFTE